MHFSDFQLTPSGEYLVAEPTKLNADGTVPKPRFVRKGTPLYDLILKAQEDEAAA
jgi:hypothetical protein